MSSTTTIAGRYELEGRLGVGGMSTVYLAMDHRLERHVAIKLLAEHLADDPAFVSRFRREALAAARLVHPNIVQVFDFGLDERQHQHFIVMEHVSGQSCAELLRDRGHLDVDQGLEIVTQACRGLEYAHRNGVVHRDVKPGNLLVSESEVVKLADFGIARATDQSSITQVGSVLGTAAYLAPEQARGEEAGPRADIYSLGVVTYQLLSGRLPYEATSLSELALMQQRERPTPLEDINPRVRPELADAVSMALEIDQESRPHDANEFAEALRKGARGIDPVSDTAPTAHLGTRAGTRVLPALPADDSPTEATRARQLTPREPVPPRVRLEQTPARGGPTARQRAATATTQAPPKRRRRGRRALVLLLMLAFFVVVVAAAAVIATDTSNTVVHFRKVIAHDVQDAINQVHNLINKYTK